MREEHPVNEEELGHVLGTALAPPDLQVMPYAGARLRERARRQRAGRLAAGSAAALVLVVLAAFGAVRITTARSTPSVAAAAKASPVRMLHTSLAIWLGPEAQQDAWPPCGSQPPCPELPISTLSVVAELRVTGNQVAARMLPDDATMFELYTHPKQRADLVARVGSRSLPARYADGVVRITAPTAAQAAALAAAAGSYRPVAPTGPGPLDREPLQMYAVQSTCHSGPEGLWRLVGQCLTAGADPVISIRDADLRLRRSGSEWTLAVGLNRPDRDTLARWTAAHAGQQILYMIPRGKSLGPEPVNASSVTRVSGRMTSIEIPVPDAGAGMALISRLRS
jgi:hypothetical protein